MKKVLRKLLPGKVIGRLKKTHQWLDKKLIVLFAGSKWGASLYYFLLSRQFGREHQAVLQGRLNYYRSLQVVGKSSALLRRNTHRLEKGLIMRPRRASFAEAYILETIAVYEQALAQPELCSEEKKWATDVLVEYFSVVEDTPVIAKARARFTHCQAELTQTTASAGLLLVPKPRSSYPELQVNTAQLESLFIRRRSVRWFLPEAVEQTKLEQAVNLASLAPSACNRQPYEFIVINDATRAPVVAKCAMGTAGFADNIPCMVAVIGKLDAYPAERDRHCIYIDGSLAAMQFMLALETLGLASCPINWPDIDLNERMLTKELNLRADERPVMLIAVGYADPEGGVPYSQKKAAEGLIRDVSCNSQYNNNAPNKH